MEILWKLTRVYKYRWKAVDRNTKYLKSWVLSNYASLNMKAAQIVKILKIKKEKSSRKRNIHFCPKIIKTKKTKNETYYSKNY